MAARGGLARFGTMLAKDARVEARGKHALQAGLVLVLTFLVLDLFAFPAAGLDVRVAAALLWTPVLYATAAITARGMANEADRQTVALLRSAPVPALAVGASRTLVDAAVTLVLALLAAGSVALLFGAAIPLPALATLLVGALGLAVLGSLAGAMAAYATNREALLPILLVPLSAPILQGGLAATVAGLEGAPWADLAAPLLGVVGYGLLCIAAATLLWPILLEE